MLVESDGKRWVELQYIWKKARPKGSAKATRVSAINTLKAVPEEHKKKMAKKGPQKWFLDEMGAIIIAVKAVSIAKTPDIVKYVKALFAEDMAAVKAASIAKTPGILKHVKALSAGLEQLEKQVRDLRKTLDEVQ